MLDLAVLRQSCGDDDDFARELFVEYQQRVLELLPQLENHQTQQDYEEIRKAAHEMKGSSLTLGATEMARLAKEIEDDCRAGKFDALGRQIESLQALAAALFEHLKALNYL